MNRRSFLKRGAAVAGASVAGGLFEAAAQRAAAVPKNRSDLQSVGEESRSEPREATGDTRFQDDFSSLPAGRLTQPVEQLNGAIQEYHYLANRGVPLGPWANALCYSDAWVAGEEDGNPYLEQHLVNDPFVALRYE